MKSHVDQLLLELGNPGRYRVFIFLLLALNYFPVTFNHIVMAFIGSASKVNCSEANMTTRDTDNKTSVIMGNEQSIAQEWGLFCAQGYLVQLATTIYFLGVMVGGLVFGHLADRFGRKPIMLLTLYAQALVAMAIAFVQSYILFCVLRFVQGFLIQGLQTTTYVLCMELFLPHHRGIVGALLECVWGLAVVFLSPLCYLLQAWRYIQLAISVPSILAVSYICLVPESIRWLVTKNRPDSVHDIFSKAAKFFNVNFPSSALESLKMQMKSQDKLASKNFTFLNLFSSPMIRKRSLILCYLWFAVAVGYYGLTLNVTSLPGNRYVNFLISGSVEMVAFLLVLITIKRSRRRWSLCAFFMVGAACLLAAGVIRLIFKTDPTVQKVSTALAICGKFGMGGVFSLIFLYTSELYPTVIRNIGMGCCAFWARFGGVVAPQILLLGDFTHKAIVVLSLGVLALGGGFLTLLLPETMGKKLPDTIEEAENMSLSNLSIGNHDNDDDVSMEMEQKMLQNDSVSVAV